MRIGEIVVLLHFSFRIGKIVFFFCLLRFVLPMFCGMYFSALVYFFVPLLCVYIHYLHGVCPFILYSPEKNSRNVIINWKSFVFHRVLMRTYTMARKIAFISYILVKKKIL